MDPLDLAPDQRDDRDVAGIVESYMPLVKSLVCQFSVNGMFDRGDLVQWGSIGLLDAARRFDPEKGKFGSYAAQRILGEIREGIRSATWRKRREKTFGEPVSLEQVVAEGQDPADLLEADDQVDWELEDRRQKATLRVLLDSLPERERVIVKLHTYDGWTLAEIGSLFGLTESRISQIRTDALDRLKESA